MTDKPLEQEFLAFLEKRRQEMKEKYDRVLPTGELLFNRYDKAEYLGAGDGTSVYDTSVIMGDVRLGRHVWVGPYTLLEGVHAPVTIGDFVSVNSGVQIYSHDSTKYYVSGGRVPFKEGPVTVAIIRHRQHVDDFLWGDDRLALRYRCEQPGYPGYP